MRSRNVAFGVMAVFAALNTAPAQLYGQQAPQAQEHEQHHPATPAQSAESAKPDMMGMMARMKAANEKLDALVKKMNAAKGAEKTDAIAELLTALVQDHRAMHESMMSDMSSMMKMMGTMNTPGDATNK